MRDQTFLQSLAAFIVAQQGPITTALLIVVLIVLSVTLFRLFKDASGGVAMGRPAFFVLLAFALIGAIAVYEVALKPYLIYQISPYKR